MSAYVTASDTISLRALSLSSVISCLHLAGSLSAHKVSMEITSYLNVSSKQSFKLCNTLLDNYKVRQ